MQKIFILFLIVLSNSYSYTTQASCEAITPSDGTLAYWDDPSQSCWCGNGYEPMDGCEYYYQAELDQCEAIPNSAWDYPTNSCYCTNGYEVADNCEYYYQAEVDECALIPNSAWDYQTNTCYCTNGYETIDQCQDHYQVEINQCESIIPNGGAYWDNSFNTCYCNQAPDLLLSSNNCECPIAGQVFNPSTNLCEDQPTCVDLIAEARNSCDLAMGVLTIDCNENNGVATVSNESCDCVSPKVMVNGVCKIECDVGFHEENGQCVEDTLQCDVGFHEENGQCVPDLTQCDAGFHLENGQCLKDGEVHHSDGLVDAFIPECTHYCYEDAGTTYAVYARQAPIPQSAITCNLQETDIHYDTQVMYPNTSAFITYENHKYQYTINSTDKCNVVTKLNGYTKVISAGANYPAGYVGDTFENYYATSSGTVALPSLKVGNGVNWIMQNNHAIDFCAVGNIQNCSNDLNGSGATMDDSRLHEDLLSINNTLNGNGEKIDTTNNHLTAIKEAQGTSNNLLTAINETQGLGNEKLDELIANGDEGNTLLQSILDAILDDNNSKKDGDFSVISNMAKSSYDGFTPPSIFTFDTSPTALSIEPITMTLGGQTFTLFDNELLNNLPLNLLQAIFLFIAGFAGIRDVLRGS